MGFLDHILKKEDPSDFHQKKGSRESGEKLLRARLEEIFSKEWHHYEVRKNIPAQELNAEPGACKYSYGLYQDGRPAAMFMILNGRSDYRLSNVVKARQACEKQGIPYMNFMSYLPNEVSYISNRIYENMPR